MDFILDLRDLKEKIKSLKEEDIVNLMAYKIHPSPPPSATLYLSLLPATILTLTMALTPEDKEVLSYLLVSEKLFGKHRGRDHRPMFNCDCFACYTSYWARWDASPNRQLIHEILDAYEDELVDKKTKKKKKNVKKEKKRRTNGDWEKEKCGSTKLDLVLIDSNEPQCTDVGSEKGSVRNIVSSIGERIWGVWGVIF